MSTARHFILATAGHVDHGKSSLVKALTGTDPDRLPEEKERGISIDLGFAVFELTAEGSKAGALQVGIVDVPGHEDFIKNMVAGVGCADLALLVVAADDGWMPQTEEHLQILTYLGVTRAVVALTKVDLPGLDESRMMVLVQERLAGTPFSQAPIIPTSIVSGRGLEDLKRALAQALANSPPPANIGKPRLAIDRCFTLRGIGTIVTGTLTGGMFRRGQMVVVQPGGPATRIRTLQSHKQELEQAEPGMRTALNLADVTLAHASSGSDIRAVQRGQVVTVPELGEPSRTLNVYLERTSRVFETGEAGTRPIKDGTLVRIHYGTANVAARILLADRRHLAPGESCQAQVRFPAPVYQFAGDRFVIRDWSEQTTLAGGLVLETRARRKDFRNAAHQELLKRQAASPNQPGPALETELRQESLLRRDLAVLQSGFSVAAVNSAVDELIQAGVAVSLGNFVADRAAWETLTAKSTGLVDAYHRAHPEEIGIPLSAVRASIEADLGLTEASGILLEHLAGNGFVQVEGRLKRASHRPSLPAALQTDGARLRDTLARTRLDPPSRKELALDGAAQQALRFLVQTGEVVEIGPDIVLRAEDFAAATASIKRHLTEHATATVSELKQAVGASRRIVVPLLEKLDRAGITRRQGDVRVLGHAK